jgi:hypothetical protein
MNKLSQESLILIMDWGQPGANDWIFKQKHQNQVAKACIYSPELKNRTKKNKQAKECQSWQTLSDGTVSFKHNFCKEV